MNLLIFAGVPLLLGCLFARSRSLSRDGWAQGTAVVVVAFAGFACFQLGRPQLTAFSAANGVNEKLSPTAADLAAGAGAQTGFLSWAGRQITSGRVTPTFWLAPVSAQSDPFTEQWSTYQLLPARQVEAPQQANWIVFYGIDPRRFVYDRAAFPRLLEFSPTFAIAERMRVR